MLSFLGCFWCFECLSVGIEGIGSVWICGMIVCDDFGYGCVVGINIYVIWFLLIFDILWSWGGYGSCVFVLCWSVEYGYGVLRLLIRVCGWM